MGIFAENRYFDVTMEYAKVNPLDILIRVSATNRGPEAATLHLLLTLWFRNTWAWGIDDRRPVLTAVEPDSRGRFIAPTADLSAPGNVRLVHVQHHELGEYWLACEGTPELLFCIAMALIDSDFAKNQLLLMLHERYMHPNGELPAYKWAFSDVNPPVHAWVAWRIYLQEKERTGKGDTVFLERIFQKLMLNFTWWVNRKDADGNNVFAGGFLGLDNIGGFDRNMTLPEGIVLEQADGTAWMGMFAVIMLAIAMELARTDPVYEDMAAKLLDHYLYIADAIYGGGQTGLGLWNEEDGFFYDKLSIPDGRRISLKVRSLVGLLPLLAMETLPTEQAEAFVDARMRWFAENRPYVSRLITRLQDVRRKGERKDVVLLAMVRGDDLRHPAPPRATTCWETTPPPGNGALDTRAGWWARQYVVARGEVGGGWALVGARRRANRNMSGREGKPTTYPDQLDKVHYRGEFLRSHANTE